MLRRGLLSFAVLLGGVVAAARAEPLTATLVEPPKPQDGYFKMGADRDPAGHALTLDNRSLRIDGEAWMPAMGEFHYSRYPAGEWREELLKMRAGGLEIVSTYVFWIHHEEIEGAWNWSGDRDLRRFVETAREIGLKVVVRCGPWCHGEVRNGGLPEWAVLRDWKLRSTDPRFLAAVRELYGLIATQLHGLLWKDGGPVIGIQLDNEYYGPAEYLVALKRIAQEVGLDVPLYTRTGWPPLTTPIRLGEIVPLYGVYAEGFWDRALTSMPGQYWAGFQFSTLRTDAAIATDLLGKRAAHDDADIAAYPYLTCEIGGGMMNSYHRRILIDPRDIEATTLVKIAGGSTLPGYYMYHGGTNPEGQRTTLMEAQDTLNTNYNDLPVKTYDFQAPLGEFGEVRPQYHRLRRLHSFLHDYGSDLTAKVAVLPDRRPTGKEDVTTLRWAVRSDGRSGFVFVNNHERGRTLPLKTGVQFDLTLARGGRLTFPSEPVSVASDVMFIWPFNLDVGGLVLHWATVEPFAHIVEGNGVRTLFFATTPGVTPELAFDTDRISKIETNARLIRSDDVTLVQDIKPSHGVAARLLTKNGDVVQCVVLDDADSLAVWKGSFAGRQRVVLTRSDVVFDRDALRVTATAPGAQRVEVFPAPREPMAGAAKLDGSTDGVFRRYWLPAGYTTVPVAFEAVRGPGPLREIKRGPIKEPVAMEPKDADFGAAAVWHVKLPAGIDWNARPMLRFSYVGDVARATLDGKLLTDDFYNGAPRDLGLWRYAPAIRSGDLQFAVLPLQKDAPIFLAPAVRLDFGTKPSLVELRKVELIEATTTTITAKPGPEPILPQNFKTDYIPPRPPPSRF